MSDQLPGKRPILPPVYFLVAVALMVSLHLLLPGAQLIGAPLRYSGLLVAAAALGLVLWAAGHFRRRGTPIKPFQDASALVLEGPYRLTHNPMYVGLVGMLFGLGLLLGSASPFVVIPVFVVLVDVRFIRAEEAALHRTFGAAYSDYKAQVRRWVVCRRSPTSASTCRSILSPACGASGAPARRIRGGRDRRLRAALGFEDQTRRR